MSIRLKLTIIILALVTIPLLFVSLISFSHYENSLEASRLSQLENLADFKADRLEAHFAGLRTQIEMAQSFYIIRKHLPLLIRSGNGRSDPPVTAARKVLDGQLKGIQASAGLFDIILADSKGRILYASDSANNARAMFTTLPEVQLTSFKQGLNKISFSEIFLNEPAGNRPEMVISAPAFDLNDSVIGVIVFEMDMAPLYKIIQDTTGLGKTGEILIGKKISANEIRYLNPLRHDPGAALKRSVAIGTKTALPIQMAVRGETGIGRSIDYRDIEVVAAWRYIPSLKWGLVAKIDCAEAFATVNDLRKLLILVLAAVFALVSIIILSVARSISRPINMLTQGAEIVGGGNLDYRVGTTLKDEIGRLSRSFDKMTHDLKETTASRDELNREIEQRKAAEREREFSIEFLQLVNGSTGLDGLITSSVSFFKEKSGFEAVGIRLKKGGDYPYFETNGFPGEFVRAEMHLCNRDGEGRPVYGAEGYPIMECMCGSVIQGRSDPSRSFFTNRGDYWSNSTTELLAASTEAGRQPRMRNRCNSEGYESVGLFALRAAGETLGLLQLNDRRKGMFSPVSLTLWERLSDYLSVAVSKFLALQALRESETGLKRAQKISHLGSWELDLMMDRLTWSDEVYRIFGFKPQEFNATYEAFLEAVHPDDRAAVDAAYSGSIRDGKDMYEIEHRVARKESGEIRYVHERCEHFRDESGKIVRSVGMVQDITERKKAEEGLRRAAEDLERSNKDLEQFAYVASHDLQEPLRAVGGFMGLLRKQYGEQLGAGAKEYIDQSIEGAERMQALINDLLTFSRVGTRGAAFAVMNMKEAVDRALKNLQAAIAESDTLVTYGAMPEVSADLSQMTQLLQNIIGNAVKFHGLRRPEIRINADHKGSVWEFSVADNGIGIEPQYFDRIFLLFQRLHTRSQYKGTGIGLAVCKKIVERHGGKLWVESRFGEGSTFFFTLPERGNAL